MKGSMIPDGVSILEPPQADTEQWQAARAPLVVRSFGLTDRGKVRERNEDQFLIATLVKALQVEQTSLPLPKVQHSSDRSYLFVVADGMGGHAGGDKASALAIESVEDFMLETFKWFFQFKGREEDRLLNEFQSALGQANARVLSEAAEHPELHGMGTTLTMAYGLNNDLFVAHVGDSRCYLVRDQSLHRLTSDHTLVEEMVRRGAIPEKDAAHHHWRHVITNVVGRDSSEVQVEVHKVHLQAGDRILLCSDGLTEMVSEEAIGRVLSGEASPEGACKELLAQANQAGGRDNITIIVAAYEETRAG
ncbi:MAG TPA: Stp1/IreP family PP2C-type Ser/Thr phosphatase [Gemmataceae bacterium]|nr:Stp1/IreP family PP2C-type Ser/Thr phosphatase [Gemmataceae bacterium]